MRFSSFSSLIGLVGGWNYFLESWVCSGETGKGSGGGRVGNEGGARWSTDHKTEKEREVRTACGGAR